MSQPKAKEIKFSLKPDAQKESRCFFCYGLFDDGEVICQIEDKIYHLACLKDMLIANEIQELQLFKLDHTIEIVQGYMLKYPKPIA